MPIHTAFEDMEREFAALDLLNTHRCSYPAAMLTVLHSLKGANGTEVEARMKAVSADNPTSGESLSQHGKDHQAVALGC
jgi:hypothetical protein